MSIVETLSDTVGYPVRIHVFKPAFNLFIGTCVANAILFRARIREELHVTIGVTVCFTAARGEAIFFAIAFRRFGKELLTVSHVLEIETGVAIPELVAVVVVVAV
tara:strand:+ start:127 stop:441 length:315 start_codon:yes stop_codon:yes gene_type:complete